MSERRALQDQVASHFSRTEAEATPLSVLVAGLDDFHPVNDSLSAELRDRILEQFRDAVLSLAGSTYRLRGNIYATLMPGTSAQAAISMAEQLRETVARIALTPADEASVSLGVASYPESVASAAELVYGAQTAMYWVKAIGENRVGYWGDLVSTERRRVETPGHGERPVIAPDGDSEAKDLDHHRAYQPALLVR
ncbi:MAG: GGDEF domain-containing protein [Dehalococcoidia bacterium]